MHKTMYKGNIAETACALELMKMGLTVSVPIGGGHSYDLVVDLDNKLLKIQVKSRKLEDGHILCDTRSNNGRMSNKPSIHRYYYGKVDLLIIYCPELNEFYCFKPFKDKNKCGLLIKIDKPKNNQKRKINWAKDYVLTLKRLKELFVCS